MSAGMNCITGRRLEGRDHLRQSIADVLGTPIGTRVMRRDYGSLLPDLVDQPLAGPTLLRAYAASAEAVMRWVPDARMQQVHFEVTADGHLVLDVEVSESAGSSSRLSVPLGLRGVLG